MFSFDWSILQQSLPLLGQGAMVTLKITVTAIALGMVLGWKGRADVVRAGADRAEVTAVFDLPAGHPATPILAEAGIAAEGELILRRVAQADGRRQAQNHRHCQPGHGR